MDAEPQVGCSRNGLQVVGKIMMRFSEIVACGYYSSVQPSTSDIDRQPEARLERTVLAPPFRCFREHDEQVPRPTCQRNIHAVNMCHHICPQDKFLKFYFCCLLALV